MWFLALGLNKAYPGLSATSCCEIRLPKILKSRHTKAMKNILLSLVHTLQERFFSNRNLVLGLGFLVISLASPDHLEAQVLLPHLVNQEQINRLELADGELWVFGSRNLYRLDGAGQTAEKIANMDGRATSIASFEGHTFIGTTSGLFRLAPKGVVSVLPKTPISSLKIFEERLWIGSHWGLFLLGQEQPIHKLQVMDLEVDQGKLWIASIQGAFRIDSSSPNEVDAIPPSESPLSSLIDLSGDTSLSFLGIHVQRAQSSKEIWFTSLEDLQFDRPGAPYRIAEGSATPPSELAGWHVASMTNLGNDLLFAAMEGVARSVNGKIELLQTSKPVKYLFEWDHKLGLCTTQGLLRGSFDTSAFEPSPAGGLLVCNDSETYRNSLWIAADRGLFRYYSDVYLNLESFFGLVLSHDGNLKLRPVYDGLPGSAEPRADADEIKVSLAEINNPLTVGLSKRQALLQDPFGNVRTKTIWVLNFPPLSLFATTLLITLLLLFLFKLRGRD